MYVCVVFIVANLSTYMQAMSYVEALTGEKYRLKLVYYFMYIEMITNLVQYVVKCEISNDKIHAMK